MDRQDELLERKDGRYFAIDKVGTGLGSVGTEERLGKKTIVGFGLPSGPALFLSLAFRAFSQIKDVESKSFFDSHDEGCWPDHQERLFDFFENSIAHVVFSFGAIEAFSNEMIPTDFQYKAHRRDGSEQILQKADIERQINLDEKLHVVLPMALSVASPKTKPVWQRYKAIKTIRDRIIHLKSIDRQPSGPENETLWGTLLKTHGQPFCDYAHSMIGHFNPKSRWYRKYPYASPRTD